MVLRKLDQLYILTIFLFLNFHFYTVCITLNFVFYATNGNEWKRHPFIIKVGQISLTAERMAILKSIQTMADVKAKCIFLRSMIKN